MIILVLIPNNFMHRTPGWSSKPASPWVESTSREASLRPEAKLRLEVRPRLEAGLCLEARLRRERVRDTPEKEAKWKETHVRIDTTCSETKVKYQ